MAAPLASKIVSSVDCLLAQSKTAVTNGLMFQQQRFRAKTKGGQVGKNRQQTHTRPKHRGPWVSDGGFVYKGDVLAKQAGLTLYPGENVGIQRNHTLYALTDGIVIVTCEALNPYPDSPLYDRVQKGMKIYKRFWHVYPTPVHAKFQLVSQV